MIHGNCIRMWISSSSRSKLDLKNAQNQQKEIYRAAISWKVVVWFSLLDMLLLSLRFLYGEIYRWFWKYLQKLGGKRHWSKFPKKLTDLLQYPFWKLWKLCVFCVNLCILRLETFTQPTFTCSKSKIETSVNDVGFLSLLLTLNRFHTLFWCFYCWLWTSKFRLR